MYFIPELKEMEEKAATFIIQKDCFISKEGPEIDASLAEILQEEIEELSGIKIPIYNKREIPKRNESIALKLNRETPNQNLGLEGYLLNVDRNCVVVTANSSHGIFYGIQTLLQLIKKEKGKFLIPCVKITDWPALKMRGVHYIPSGETVDEMKKNIKILSTYKINALLIDFWNEAHAGFKFKTHPEIGDTGGFNAGEIKELVSYAKRYYVEIIPSVNSFSHFNCVLKHKEYAHLAEQYANLPGKRSSIQLCPLNKDSLKLIRDLYQEVIPLFEGKYFHIGCDETYWLGCCKKCQEEIKKIGKIGLFNKFLTQLFEILNGYGKKVIFWDDMALQYPKVIEKLPKGLIYADWNYGPEYGNKRYPAIEYIKNKGMEVIACPASAFNNFQNIREFIYEACKHKILGEITTQWTKGFEIRWQELILSGEIAWSGKRIRQKDFDTKFVHSFYGIDSQELVNAVHDLLKRVSSVPDVDKKDIYMSKKDIYKLKELEMISLKTLRFVEREKQKAKKNKDNLDFLILKTREFFSRIKKLLALDMTMDLPAKSAAIPEISLERDKSCSLTKTQTLWGHTLLAMKNEFIEITIVPEIGGRIFGTFFPNSYEEGIKDKDWLLQPEIGGEMGEWGGFDDKLYYNRRLYHHIGYRCGYHKYQYEILNNSEQEVKLKVSLITPLVKVERIMSLTKGKPDLEINIKYTNLYEKAWVSVHAHPNMKLRDMANYALHLVAPTRKGIIDEPLFYLNTTHTRELMDNFSEGWIGAMDTLEKKAIIVYFDLKQIKNFSVCYGDNTFNLEPWGVKKNLNPGQSTSMDLRYSLLHNVADAKSLVHRLK